MNDFRRLSDLVLASPQITADQILAAKEIGVTLIVNNRPDGEAPDQPSGAEIGAAAKQAGLDYIAIPVTSAGFSLPQVKAMHEALDSAEGQVLAFCRSGTRSTFLWALAQAQSGSTPESIAHAAASAGYDVSPIRTTLDMLAGQSNA